MSDMRDWDAGYDAGYAAGRASMLEEIRNPPMVCSECGAKVVHHPDDSWGHFNATEAGWCKQQRGDAMWYPVRAWEFDERRADKHLRLS